MQIGYVGSYLNPYFQLIFTFLNFILLPYLAPSWLHILQANSFPPRTDREKQSLIFNGRASLRKSFNHSINRYDFSCHVFKTLLIHCNIQGMTCPNYTILNFMPLYGICNITNLKMRREILKVKVMRKKEVNNFADFLKLGDLGLLIFTKNLSPPSHKSALQLVIIQIFTLVHFNAHLSSV